MVEASGSNDQNTSKRVLPADAGFRSESPDRSILHFYSKTRKFEPNRKLKNKQKTNSESGDDAGVLAISA